MGVLAVGFSKMLVEKKNPLKGKISINHNTVIQDVKEAELAIGNTKQKSLTITFQFTTDYTSDASKDKTSFAHLSLEGDLVWVDKPEGLKESYKAWQENKQLPKDTLVPVMNSVISKSMLQALVLTKEMNLPSPLRLPHLSPESVK